MDGDTLTQGASPRRSKRVMWQSGSWTGGTAAGQFVVTNPSGGNFWPAPRPRRAARWSRFPAPRPRSRCAWRPLRIRQSQLLRPAGDPAHLWLRRVNQCFEFDGTTLAPITTGLSPDVPSHICFHKNFLFVSQGSSISYCGAGTRSNGRGRRRRRDRDRRHRHLHAHPAGRSDQPGARVYLRSNFSILYGSDPTTFNYVRSIPASARCLAARRTCSTPS
jgi:hypothetical protein